MKRRWGSLSRSGVITLNIMLVMAPMECIDYVVAHELCHLVHKNHGPQFYTLLDRIMSDWRQRKALLESTLA